MDESVNYRIGYIQFIILLGVSALSDLVRILLNLFTIGVFANRLVSPVVNLSFFSYFKIKGITFLEPKPKKGLTGAAWKMIASFFFSFIPVLDFTLGLFANTMSTYSIVSQSRYEDKLAAQGKKSSGVNKRSDKTGGQPSAQKSRALMENNQVGSEVKPPIEARKAIEDSVPSQVNQNNQTNSAEIVEIAPPTVKTASMAVPIEKSVTPDVDKKNEEGTLEDIIMDKGFDPYREEAA